MVGKTIDYVLNLYLGLRRLLLLPVLQILIRLKESNSLKGILIRRHAIFVLQPLLEFAHIELLASHHFRPLLVHTPNLLQTRFRTGLRSKSCLLKLTKGIEHGSIVIRLLTHNGGNGLNA